MKEVIMSNLAKLSPHFVEKSYIGINTIIKPQYLYKNFKNLSFFKHKNPDLYQSSREALKAYCLTERNTDSFETYLKSYAKQKLKRVQKETKNKIEKDEPILVCAVKDDIYKVRMQLTHHRELGIQNIVYIDNMSTDGTYEYLLKEGVDVYRVDEHFNEIVKNSWFRQITDQYGYNRWYLILDSDELFVYPGMEKKSLKEFIQFAEKYNMDYVQSFMIDMYSKRKINSIPSNGFSMDEYNIKVENCYFDTETYKYHANFRGKRIVGGPRSRVFSSKSHIFEPLLTKNPLIYLTENRLFGVHQSRPFRYNFDKPIISGLLHYKFLPLDGEKYVKIAEDGNYAGGSIEYKHYLKKIQEEPELYFFYQGSQKYINSSDLLKINIFDKELSREFMFNF